MIFLFEDYNHGYVYSISINEHTIASGSTSCQIWDIRQKQRLYTIEHINYVRKVQLLPSGSCYDLITSGDTTIKVWNGGELVKTLEHSSSCYSFHLNPERTMLACSHQEGVTVWSTADWKNLADLKIDWIVDVKFNSASNQIIAAHYKGEVSIIDLE